MTKVFCTSIDNFRTELKHENGALIITDGPREIGGKGEMFSPTDLFLGSIISCILTIMGMRARKLRLDITGCSIEAEKKMIAGPPRRVGSISIIVKIPLDLEEPLRKELEEAACTCPVKTSIHQDIDLKIEFLYEAGFNKN